MIIEVDENFNLEENLDLQNLDLQNGIFYIDNQIDSMNKLKIFKNKINIDEKFPFKISHIIATGNFLQKNVKYFSFANLIEKSLTDCTIENSRAKEILNFITSDMNSSKESKILLCNSYFYPKNKKITVVEFLSTHRQLVDSSNQNLENFVPFISFKEYGNIMRKEVFSEYFCLIGAKILSSSFFLHELLDFWPYFFEYPLTENRFFNNFQEAKDFFSEISYEDRDFYKLQSFSDFSSALEFLKNYRKIAQFANLPYVVFQRDNIFCHSSISTSPERNSLFLAINSINVSSKFLSQYKKRELYFNSLLDTEDSPEDFPEDYANSYDFYMHGVLKLHKKSLGNLFLRNIYMFFLNKKDRLSSPSPFLEKLKTQCLIKNNKIFHGDSQIFFSQSNWDTKKIQKFSKLKNISKFYIANIEKNQLELHYSIARISSMKRSVKITY